MKCFYHNDADGRCSGHIVARHYKGLYGPDDFIEITYGDEFPFDIIKDNETVYIVDYSIEPEEMERLLEITEDIIWIDHHITTIQKYKDFPKDIPGFRVVGVAGCVLTWLYFNKPDVLDVKPIVFEPEELPDPIKYIGDRDVWTWKYGDDTLHFCSGAELHDMHPLSCDWITLFENIKEVMQEGLVVERYKRQKNKLYINEFGFTRKFEGHTANIVNVGQVDSKIFDSLENLEEIQIMYVYTGKYYKVSIRSQTVDVSKIAVKYGGGGHKEAAGWECEELPWESE